MIRSISMLSSRAFSWQLSRVSRRGFFTAFITGTLTAATDSVQNQPPVNMPASMPHPKFWFGQRVCNEWVCDDELDEKYGHTIRDYGVVVGMVYKESWTYYVSWEKLGNSDHLPLPHVDQACENELTLI